MGFNPIHGMHLDRERLGTCRCSPPAGLHNRSYQIYQLSLARVAVTDFSTPAVDVDTKLTENRFVSGQATVPPLYQDSHSQCTQALRAWFTQIRSLGQF